MANDSLEEVAFIPGPHAGYAYREMKTYKHYLYIVSEGGSGVQIVDLSQLPDTAIHVKNFNFALGNDNIQRSHTVTLADGFLYLNGSANWGNGGMIIFDLHADPTTPQYVGQYQPDYIHDSYVRNDTIFGAAIYSGGGLYVADATNKANPTTFKFIPYSGSGTHHAWATTDGRYALTTDEIGNTPSSLKIWDYKNPGVGPPYTPASNYRANPTDKIHNVHGRGNYAYISHYGAGARVVDVHNPLTPTEVGGYDSYPGSVANYVGSWAVYPYFFSGRWIESDMQTGLYLMSFDQLLPRSRPTSLFPSNGSSVTDNSITFQWTSSAHQSEDPHWYELVIYGQNFNKTMKVKDTVTTIANSALGLQNGQEYSWFVKVMDEYTEVNGKDTMHFTFNGTSVNVKDNSVSARKFTLAQNYPNPFNPITKINFSLHQTDAVSLKIFNIVGDEIATLFDGIHPQGAYEIFWNAAQHTSGIYYYRLTVGNTIETKKMILMK
ncbi:MAG: choice-of-anchor B family protein, partial [Bacteroidota bacterium]